MGNKSIVFFCCDSCQRLEPVGIMRSTVFHSPILHCFCHNISSLFGQFSALVDDFVNLLEGSFWQTLFHFSKCKYLGSKEFFNIYHFHNPFSPYNPYGAIFVNTYDNLLLCRVLHPQQIIFLRDN